MPRPSETLFYAEAAAIAVLVALAYLQSATSIYNEALSLLSDILAQSPQP